MTTALELESAPITRARALEYLTQCADARGDHWYAGARYRLEECLTCNGTNRAGWLHCFSRYGSRSDECAPVAWRVAWLTARESGTAITAELLEHCMGMVVNDHPDVSYMVRAYGWRHYQ